MGVCHKAGRHDSSSVTWKSYYYGSLVQGPSKGPHDLTSTGPHLSEIRHWLWSVRDYRNYFFIITLSTSVVCQSWHLVRMWGSTCMITPVLLWEDIWVHKVGLTRHLLLKGRTGMDGHAFVFVGLSDLSPSVDFLLGLGGLPVVWCFCVFRLWHQNKNVDLCII